MKFGFIAHASEQYDLESFQFYNIGRKMSLMPDFRKAPMDNASCFDLIHIPEMKSKAGSTTEGRILYLPMTAKEMVDDQEKAFDAVYNAAKDLENWGAGIIGLGGFSGIVGNRGLDLADKLSVPITTGNSFTVYNSIYACDIITKRLGIDMQKQKVAVVGFPGSIGLAIAKILAKRGVPLILVGRRDAKFFDSIIRQIRKECESADVEFCNNVSEALKKSTIIFSATSSGEIIDPVEIPPWTIFLDIAVPGDVKYILPDNTSLLYVYGGTFDLCDEVVYGGTYGQIFRNNFPGCIGETILLAFENVTEDFSIGRELDIAKVELIGSLGHKHGFEVITPYDGFTSLPVSEEIIQGYKIKMEKNRNKINLSNDKNSVGHDLPEVKGIEFKSVCGKHYDFCNAKGAAIIGHDSRLRKVVTDAMDGNISFYSSGNNNPVFSELAEQLISFAPKNFNKVFFGNSIEEALEEAFRISRIITGKDVIVCTENSITAAKQYKDAFCEVAYGDLEGLKKCLQSETVAAFIVSPLCIQEDCVVSPSDYIENASRLCKENDCLLIVDETLTGMGRTGSLFACSQLNIETDILIAGNSLGAGIIPMAAVLTSRRILRNAGIEDIETSNYYANSYLHNIAGLVSVELIRILFNEGLIEQAKENGEYFLKKMQEIQSRNKVVKCISGMGMLLKVELRSLSSDACGEFFSDALSMINQKITETPIFTDFEISKMLSEFYDSISEAIYKKVKRNIDGENSLRLLKEYKIDCPSADNSFLITPPLNTTKEEIDFFVKAFEEFCKSMDDFTLWRNNYLL